MSSKKPSIQPKYMCWCEPDFWADREVVSMPHQARAYYRTLLQAAYWTSTRPYLPDDDAQLWQLADATSIVDWQVHKQIVLAKFQPFTKGDQKLLAHKRLLRDWKQIVVAYEQTRAAGKKSAESRRRIASLAKERTLNGRLTDAQQTETETETETNIKTERENQTETGTGTKLKRQSARKSGKLEADSEAPVSASANSSSLSLSVSSGSEYGSVSVPGQPSESVTRLSQMWSDLVKTPAHDLDFRLLLQEGHSETIISETLKWAIRTSNHWGDKLKTSADFERAFSTIRSQCEKYMGKARPGGKADRSQGPAAELESDSAFQDDIPVEELEQFDE
jgi:uncharacterized protein YdaU (DUF1376 family)